MEVARGGPSERVRHAALMALRRNNDDPEVKKFLREMDR
jgi:hypothetical protein